MLGGVYLAVSIFFGLPGCGKTTLMTAFALKFVRGKRYSNVYCNVPISVDGVTIIDNANVGIYNLSDGALLIDEGTLFADNRAYATFSFEKIQFMLLHRHYNIDIYIFLQQWDGIDKKIRVITDRVYYMYKPMIIGKWITKYYRIPYGIIIPDPKKSDSEKLGEIVQGYCKPHWIIRLFSPTLFRPMYYKYFNSWDRPYLPELPEEYSVYDSELGICLYPKNYRDIRKLCVEMGNYPGVADDVREELLAYDTKKVYMRDILQCEE